MKAKRASALNSARRERAFTTKFQNPIHLSKTLEKSKVTRFDSYAFLTLIKTNEVTLCINVIKK